MKKKVLLTVGAMVVAGGIGLTLFQQNVVGANPKLTHEDIRTQVSAAYPGTITELEIVRKENRPIYEVEIELDDIEYVLEIDGNTGEVLKLERQEQMKKEVVKEEKKNDDDSQKEIELEKEVEVPKATNPTPSQPKKEVVSNTNQVVNQKPTQAANQNSSTKSNQSKTKTVISRDQAISIALAQFSGTVTDVDLEDDNNRLVYEIEIENGNSEAEIKIDAYTGQVIVIDIETDNDDDDDGDYD